MASNYGLNFGFRRSDEHMRSGTEGRLRVPAAGAFKQGDFVTFDPANPGYITKAAANTPIAPGYSGFLIQEDAWDIPINGNQVVMTYDLDVVHNSSLCAIWTGAGLKVWFRNTPSAANRGQRARDAVTKVTVAGLAIGDLLAWDGAKYVETATEAQAVARVTLTNASDYVEAVLLK
jgi:hypothetical protein